MEITISSRHVEVTPTVRSIAQEKLAKLGRHLEGMDRAEVHFSEERNPRIEQRAVCEVSMHGHGHQVRAKAHALDQLSAIDAVVEKLEQQLERLKTRLVERHQGKGHASRATRTGPAPAPTVEPEAAPVKLKRFRMTPMSVEDAALHMELLSHAFYVFVRDDTGDTAVLYRRSDGSLGLIEVEPDVGGRST